LYETSIAGMSAADFSSCLFVGAAYPNVRCADLSTGQQLNKCPDGYPCRFGAFAAMSCNASDIGEFDVLSIY